MVVGRVVVSCWPLAGYRCLSLSLPNSRLRGTSKGKQKADLESWQWLIFGVLGDLSTGIGIKLDMWYRHRVSLRRFRFTDSCRELCYEQMLA